MSLDNEVDQLTGQMSGLQCDDKKSEDPIEKIKQQVGYSGSSHFGLNMANEKNKEPIDEDDPKFWLRTMLGQVKSLQTTMSVPLLQVVQVFNGDGSKFKQWVKDVERYATMARLGDSDIPQIVHIACSGLVGDFVQRYIEECQTDKVPPSWSDLKTLMTKRFSEVQDSQYAMALLRRIRQGPNETVQLYSERLLRVAEDAYPLSDQDHESSKVLVQKQLIDIFCDGLFHDFLRYKVLREDPKTFAAAVEIAMKEQNLRKRFNLRSGNNFSTLLATNDRNETQFYNPLLGSNDDRNAQFYNQSTSNATFQTETAVAPPALSSWVSQSPKRDIDPRSIEPMEIDHNRNLKCFRCHGFGHIARKCPTSVNRNRFVVNAADNRENNDPKPVQTRKTYVTRNFAARSKVEKPDRNTIRRPPTGQNRNMNQAPSQIPDWIRGAECWICHMIGHLKRNCPNRPIPDRNRVPMYPKGNGPRVQEN